MENSTHVCLEYVTRVSSLKFITQNPNEVIEWT